MRNASFRGQELRGVGNFGDLELQLIVLKVGVASRGLSTRPPVMVVALR
jgi:hypothetical protein